MSQDPKSEAQPGRPAGRETIALAVCTVLVIVVAAGFLIAKAIVDPRVLYLSSDSRARWIVYPLLPAADIRSYSLTTEFHKTFDVPGPRPQARARLRAFTAPALAINGVEVPLAASWPLNWKREYTVDLSPFLTAGKNDITVSVVNGSGPPALWLVIAGQGFILRSDATWDTRIVAPAVSPPVRAVFADEVAPLPAAAEGISPFAALREKAIMLATVFFLSATVFLLIRFFVNRHTIPGAGAGSSSFPRVLLGFALVAWAALFINNAHSLEAFFRRGFDVDGHLSYIMYIARTGSLPMPHEGWSMYHPPLFYALAALLYNLVAGFRLDNLAAHSLRLIPFLSAAGQLFLAYWAARLLFPGNRIRQAATVAAAALLPMNIYMSQYISNEPLAAFLTGLAVVMALSLLSGRATLLRFLALGLVAGAALLTKVSALPFIAVIVAVLTYALAAQKQYSARTVALMIGGACVVAVLVSGWFYVRNYLLYGKPFVGNWELGASWWQDPGYRTFQYYSSFGAVFSEPYFSGFFSFADSLYSTLWGDGFLGGAITFSDAPPWNYAYMSAGYVLALPATALILFGLFRMAKDALIGLNKQLLLVVSQVAVFMIFLLYLTLIIPAYSTAKAFYGLSLVIPLSLAFAWGMDAVDDWLRARNYQVGRAILYGWLCTLAFAIVQSYAVHAA